MFRKNVEKNVRLFGGTGVGELVYLPCSLRSPLDVVEKSLGTRRAATKMASPPNFHHHFHCYFGHSWSHFTAERSQRTHSRKRAHRFWHLLQPKEARENRWRVRSRAARRPAFCDPSVSDGGASSWNRSNVTFAWWPQIAPVSIQYARGALILVSRRGYREAGAHLAARRGWPDTETDTDLGSFHPLSN